MNQPLLTFQSLNALRFFAFFSVFLLHIPGFEGSQFLGKIVLAGNVSGVDFFFTLSGFLISYLLCYEKIATGKINGRNYFLRRSLRIWPLYFLGVGIAFLNNFISQKFHLGNPDGYSPNPLYSLTFLENYQMIIHDNFPNGAPLRVFWSLCVEEHFYLLWFLIFSVTSTKQLPKIFGFLWLTGITYRMWFHAYFPENSIDDYDLLSKMDFFCAGGLSGWMVATRFEKVKSYFKQILFYQRTIIAVLMVFLFYSNLLFPGLPFKYLYIPSISALLYACIILMTITTSWLIFEEVSPFSQLGKISYAMYVYHTVVIVALGALLKYSGLMVEGWFTKVTFAIIALGISIIVSYFSYRYFEKPFLRFKTRFRIKEREPNQAMRTGVK